VSVELDAVRRRPARERIRDGDRTIAARVDEILNGNAPGVTRRSSPRRPACEASATLPGKSPRAKLQKGSRVEVALAHIQPRRPRTPY